MAQSRLPPSPTVKDNQIKSWKSRHTRDDNDRPSPVHGARPPSPNRERSIDHDDHGSGENARTRDNDIVDPSRRSNTPLTRLSPQTITPRYRQVPELPYLPTLPQDKDGPKAGEPASETHSESSIATPDSSHMIDETDLFRRIDELINKSPIPSPVLTSHVEKTPTETSKPASLRFGPYPPDLLPSPRSKDTTTPTATVVSGRSTHATVKTRSSIARRAKPRRKAVKDSEETPLQPPSRSGPVMQSPQKSTLNSEEGQASSSAIHIRSPRVTTSPNETTPPVTTTKKRPLPTPSSPGRQVRFGRKSKRPRLEVEPQAGANGFETLLSASRLIDDII